MIVDPYPALHRPAGEYWPPRPGAIVGAIDDATGLTPYRVILISGNTATVMPLHRSTWVPVGPSEQTQPGYLFPIPV